MFYNVISWLKWSDLILKYYFWSEYIVIELLSFFFAKNMDLERFKLPNLGSNGFVLKSYGNALPTKL